MIAFKDMNKAKQLHLSPRQKECLSGVLELKSAKEIARDLGISPHAVEKHLRVAREKLGVASSAEAARIFAFERGGSEFPQYGDSDLVEAGADEHRRHVFKPANQARTVRLEDTSGALPLDQSLTPRQTLLTIFAVSLGSIVGLLLLVACAEGIRSLVSR